MFLIPDFEELDRLAALPGAHPYVGPAQLSVLEALAVLAVVTIAAPFPPAHHGVQSATLFFDWLRSVLPNRSGEDCARLVLVALARHGWAPYELKYIKERHLALRACRPRADAVAMQRLAMRSVAGPKSTEELLVELEHLIERIDTAIELKWMTKVQLGRMASIARDLHAAYETHPERVRGAHQILDAYSQRGPRCEAIINRLNEILDRLIRVGGVKGLTERERADLETISLVFRKALQQEVEALQRQGRERRRA